MLEQGVISPVTAPTEWCAGIVPVLKPNGKVQICVDLTELNKAIRWEVHPMPSVDESLAKLGNSKILSKLDANSGFWQIPLDEEDEADASSTGLGAVLTQVQENGEGRPICYASRSLSKTEKRYAVVEKEALAVTWASEKFSDYVLGLPFVLEMDRKPLTALLNSTELSKMPPRILHFRLRLMRYTYQVQHVPGKHQAAADALSRAPVGTPELADELFVGCRKHLQPR